MATTRPRFGDRVEHAIEERAEFELEVERGKVEAPRRGPRLRRTVFWLTVTGISLYLVAPSILDVLGSWRDVQRIAPLWLVAMLVAQALALASLWALQHVAIAVGSWHAVVTSQLASNALAKVAPGGGALGAALQYRMLVAADVPPRPAVSGLTASNLLTFAVVLALPVLALPSLVRGAVDRKLLEAGIAGLVVFILLAALCAVLLARDSVLLWTGRVAQRVRNRLRRRSRPLERLPERLLSERDRILATLGPRWKRALVAGVGRWAFDYASLLAALAAVESNARPGLVLLAFCAAQLLAQIPVTPGGLGFVEAGLTAMLTLAGVSPGKAVLATFAYRLFSYWLPMPVGFAAWIWHRRRYGGGAAAG